MPLPLGLRIVPYKNYKKNFVKSIDKLEEEYKQNKKNKTIKNDKTTKGKLTIKKLKKHKK